MEIGTESLNSVNLHKEKDMLIVGDCETQDDEVEDIDVFNNRKEKGTQMYSIKSALQWTNKRKMFISIERCKFGQLYGFDEKTGEPVHEPFSKKSKSDLEENLIENKIVSEITNDEIEINTNLEKINDNKPSDISSSKQNTLLETNITQTVEPMEVDPKPTENNEISSEIPLITQATTTPSNKQSKQVKEQMFKLPFEFGWKRELVYRAIPDATKENKGEVYYISPAGKKCRTKSEIAQHLTGELTVDNFAFSKEPIGMSPDLEIIRNAKLKERSVTDVVTGKRVPKPKAPKGASPPPQGWTPSKALKNSTFQSRSSLNSSKALQEAEKSKNNSAKNSNKSVKKNAATDIQPVINSEISSSNKKRSSIGSSLKSKPLFTAGVGGSAVTAPTTVIVDSFANNFFGNVSLGYDILRHAFQYLKVQELLRAACVCRVWNVVANNPLLWQTVRMKNSQVNDWAGLAAALRRFETKNLDLKKMLITSSDTDTMWTEFSNHIKTIVSLESIDFCRCPAKVVENLFLSNTQLKVINALAIKDDAINLSNISGMTNLQELRLKTTELCILEGDLSPLKTLKNLKHLSLTSIKYLGCRQTDFIGELINLESLELGECTDFELSFATNVLTKLNKLQRLRMENGQVNAAMLEIVSTISTIDTLIQLEIVNFDIKPGFDAKLAKCKNIKKLLLIPTYISQSATTNHIVLSAVLQLAPTLEVFTWAVTQELIRVTALYVVQCDDSKKKDKRHFDECIPVLKPVPGSLSIESESANATPSQAPQIEILPLVRVENILTAGLKRTKFKIIKIAYHATWKQNLIE